MHSLAAGEALYGGHAEEGAASRSTWALESILRGRVARSPFIGMDSQGVRHPGRLRRASDIDCPSSGPNWGSRTTSAAVVKSSAERARDASFAAHADNLFVSALARSEHISISQALGKLANIEGQLADCAAAQRTEAGERTPLPESELRIHSAYRAFRGQLFQRHGSGNDSLALRSLAQALLVGAQPQPLPTTRCAIRLAEAMWAAEQGGAPGYAEKDPLTALRAAYQLAGKDLSQSLSANYLKLLPFDSDCVGAAALFWHCAPMNGQFSDMAEATEKALSAAFLGTLDNSLKLRHQAAAMIPTQGAPAGDGPWFDGLAIRGAFNQGLAAIAHRAAANGTEEADALRLLRVRFEQLLESQDYPVGTPFQSLATVVLRLGPGLGVALDGLNQPSVLWERFLALTKAWERHRTFPFSPHLLAASHLARAADVVIGDASEAGRILTRRLRPLEALGKLPSYSEEGCSQLMLWLQQRGHSLPDDLPSLANALPIDAPVLLRELVDRYHALQNASERIVVEGQTASTLLEKYFSERLLAYSSVPTFDRRAAAESILKNTYGMPEAEVERIRRFGPIRQSAQAGAAQASLAGSAFDEFLWRSETQRSGYRNMRVSASVEIDACEALGHAHAAWQQTELKPFVQARVRESFRLAKHHIDESEISKSVRATMQDDGVGCELKSPDVLEALRRSFPISMIEGTLSALVSGDPERIAGLVPFFGSGLELTKGLMRGDGNAIVEGSLRLGLDALFLSAGRVFGGAIEAVEAKLIGSSDRARLALTALSTAGREHGFVAPESMPLVPMSSMEPAPFEATMVRAPRPVRPESLIMRNALIEAEELGPDGVGPARSFTLLFADGPTEAKLDGACFSKCESWHKNFHVREDTLQRPTVRTAVTFLKSMATVPEGAHVRLDALLEAQGPAERQIIAFLQQRVDRSPTLRLLCWNALRRLVNDGYSRTLLRAVSQATPITSFEQNTIIVPLQQEAMRRAYLGHDGEQSFTAERAYIHELVHAVTWLKDETGGAPAAHRGPVVYFTNRILRELDPDTPERLTYQAYLPRAARVSTDPVVLGESPGGSPRGRPAEPSGERPPERALGSPDDSTGENSGRDRAALSSANTALVAALEENQVLDRKIARRLSLSSTSSVLGQALGERATVKEMLAVQECLNEVASDGSSSSLMQRLGERFELERSEDMALEEWFDFQDYMSRWVTAMFEDSRSFREILGYGFPESQTRKWHIRLGKDVSGSVMTRPWRIDRQSHVIALDLTPRYCLTHGGPTPLSHGRLLLGAFLELIFEQKIPRSAFDPATNRGYQVFLENIILAEMRPIVPRINAFVSTSRSDLTKDAFKASMAATQEDAFLEQVLKFPRE